MERSERARSETGDGWLIVLVGFLVIPAMVSLGLATYFVWWPDLARATPIELARMETGQETIRVIQYWNGSDFYTVEFIWTTLDGAQHTRVIDGDASTIWRAELRETPDGAIEFVGNGYVMWRHEPESEAGDVK